MTIELPYHDLVMTRDVLDNLPSFACPSGYTIRTFLPGDEQHWATVETLAGEFEQPEAALQHFEQEFGTVQHHLADRCFFLANAHGEVIGTATAWYGNFAGTERGRVHWVGIVPAEQGRKLAKPLLSAVMARLARDHTQAYLTTQTTSYRAVNMYLNFGFVPYLTDDAPDIGWRLMEQVLGRSIL